MQFRPERCLLTCANLSGADLHGANLRVRDANLFDAKLSAAKADEFTVWPDGFDPISAEVIVVASSA